MDIFGEDNQNRPDDEFEFKPLTQGLGFHKKTIDLAAETNKSNLTSQVLRDKSLPTPPSARSQTQAESVRRMVDSIPGFDQGLNPQLPKHNFITQPLPREEVTAFKSPRLSGANLGGARFEESEARAPQTTSQTSIAKHLDFTEVANATKTAVANATKAANKISADPMPIALQEVSFSITSFIFDTFMVAGLSCLFMGIVLAVTDSEISLVWANAQTDVPTRISLVILLLSVIQLYVVLSRSFFGRTIGEWAFDVQLGDAKQQQSAWYPLLVGWRAILTTLTGFVMLPILSLIAGRDVASLLTGVRTYNAQ